MQVLVEEKEDVVAFEDEVEEEVDKALTDQRWNVTTAMDQDITNMSVLEGRMTEQIMQNEEMLLMACMDEKKAEKDSDASTTCVERKNFPIILMRIFDKL